MRVTIEIVNHRIPAPSVGTGRRSGKIGLPRAERPANRHGPGFHLRAVEKQLRPDSSVDRAVPS